MLPFISLILQERIGLPLSNSLQKLGSQIELVLDMDADKGISTISFQITTLPKLYLGFRILNIWRE